jgi:hypothetical protein
MLAIVAVGIKNLELLIRVTHIRATIISGISFLTSKTAPSLHPSRLLATL